MPDFYYPLHPSTLMGGGPEPYLYSAADQAASNAAADARVKEHVAQTERTYMRFGLLEPVHPSGSLAELDAVGSLVDWIV